MKLLRTHCRAEACQRKQEPESHRKTPLGWPIVHSPARSRNTQLTAKQLPVGWSANGKLRSADEPCPLNFPFGHLSLPTVSKGPIDRLEIRNLDCNTKSRIYSTELAGYALSVFLKGWDGYSYCWSRLGAATRPITDQSSQKTDQPSLPNRISVATSHLLRTIPAVKSVPHGHGVLDDRTIPSPE